jgi:hypothetical protein
MKYLLRSAPWISLAVIWWVMISVSLCWGIESADKNQTTVRLRDAVEVNSSRVWLSDLLPYDAPSALRKAAAAIDLCPAPRPGSARVLDASQVTDRLARRPEVLRQLAIPSRITLRNLGWPMAEATVRAAIAKYLSQRGQPRDLPDGATLEWLRPLAANQEHPGLEVTGFDWDHRQQSLQVRLRCGARASCGSFVVHVVLPPELSDKWRDQLGLGRTRSSAEASPTATANGDDSELAEKGKPATLILDDGTMRISLRVICLQGGALNQQIRVVEAKSQRVFHAEVVGAGLLHAAL